MKTNHGHRINKSYMCISTYKDCSEGEWSNCPNCGLRPKIWTFDNGRKTSCGCGNNEYDHFSVHAESIMSVHLRCGGIISEYNSDKLRINWNEYCATMINPCSHGDLYAEGKW